MFLGGLSLGSSDRYPCFAILPCDCELARRSALVFERAPAMSMAAWDALRADAVFIRVRERLFEAVSSGNFRALLNNHTTTDCALKRAGAPIPSLAACGLDEFVLVRVYGSMRYHVSFV